MNSNIFLGNTLHKIDHIVQDAIEKYPNFESSRDMALGLNFLKKLNDSNSLTSERVLLTNTHEHIKSLIDENILNDNFFDRLVVTIYNGPPQTISEKYTKLLHSDCDICIAQAVEKCDFLLFETIKNPSERVMLSFLKKHYIFSNYIKKPTKNVIKYMISNNINYTYTADHVNMFNDQEVKDIVRIWPRFIRFVINQTDELCKIALEKATDLNGIRIFNDEIVEIIFNNKALLNSIDMIPSHFLTQERLIKGFKINPICIKYIAELNQEICDDAFFKCPEYLKYIPPKFQTDDMVKKTVTLYAQYAKHLHNLTKELCWQMIQNSTNNIEYVPSEFHDKEMCLHVIRKNDLLLGKCHYIDKEMLLEIFNSTNRKCLQKNMRFKYINQYNEHILERIVKADPNMLQNIYTSNQTPTIIKTALSLNGYTLQYVVNKTPEYIEIALKNQPLAKKYV